MTKLSQIQIERKRAAFVRKLDVVMQSQLDAGTIYVDVDEETGLCALYPRVPGKKMLAQIAKSFEPWKCSGCNQIVPAHRHICGLCGSAR